MTPKELNRDIKRLGSEIYRMSFEDQNEYFKYLDTTARKEFTRLAHADSECDYMNLTSIKIMLRLNLSHRFIPLHTFGLNINLKELI